MRYTRALAVALILLVAAHSAFAERLPLFQAHSKKKAAGNMFASSDELVSDFSRVMNDQTKTIVIEIQTPHSLAETAQVLRDAQAQMPTFTKLFINNDKAFVSNYISYESEEFVNKLSEQSGAKVQSYDINTNFVQQHQKALKSDSKKSIEFIRTPLSLLSRLESLLQKDLQIMNAEKVDDFNLIVLFQQRINNMRLLQQEVEEQQSEQQKPAATEAAPKSDDQQASTNFNAQNEDAPTVQKFAPSFIQPSTLFAYLMFLFIGYATYVSLVALMDLKTPKGYIKDNLNVGKES